MELTVKPRTSQQKLAEGLIPAVAYNKEKNVMFSLDRKTFDRAFRQTSTTGLYDITIEGGETFPALVRTVQMDKRRRVPVHVDFLMVKYGEALEVTVPVHIHGKSKGEKEGGLVDVVVHSLHIMAPGPRRIPQELVVDVTNLGIGDHVTAGQVQLPEGCKLLSDPDLVVISVLHARMTEEQLAAELEASLAGGAEEAVEVETVAEAKAKAEE